MIPMPNGAPPVSSTTTSETMLMPNARMHRSMRYAASRGASPAVSKVKSICSGVSTETREDTRETACLLFRPVMEHHPGNRPTGLPYPLYNAPARHVCDFFETH